MTTETTQRSHSALGLAVVGAIAIIAVVAFIAMRPSAMPAGHSAAAPTSDAVPTASPLPPAALAASDLHLEKTEDALSAALEALVKEHGYECTTMSKATIQMKPDAVAAFDKTISDEKITSGWVKDGKVFAGEPLEAAAAFDATQAFTDDGPIWILVGGDEPMAVQLRPIETPAKNVVWIPVDRITECVQHD